MESTKSNSDSNSKTTGTPISRRSTSSQSKIASNGGVQPSPLMRLFEDELKDIYWAEKALTKAMPKMIKKARSHELMIALTMHLS